MIINTDPTMNLGGDYAPENGVCVFCTVNPFQPVEATCFGIAKGESAPTYGCDTCCGHKGPCAPVAGVTTCAVCQQETALWGRSFCYGCGNHVCPACVAKAPTLPEQHPVGAHPK